MVAVEKNFVNNNNKNKNIYKRKMLYENIGLYGLMFQKLTK